MLKIMDRNIYNFTLYIFVYLNLCLNISIILFSEPDEPSKAKCPFTPDECLKLISSFFPEDAVVHNQFNCAKNCCSDLSLAEKSRIAPKKFSHALIAHNWWLVFVEGQGLFCLICKKHNMKNDINKRDVFVNTPGQRFISDAVKSHAVASVHKSAYEVEFTQRFSEFEKEDREKKAVANSVYERAFHTAYFLMKGFISNGQLIPLIDFIKDVFDCTEMKHYDHRGQGSQRDVFLFLGEALKQQLMTKMKSAESYGLLVDEVSDVSVTEHLISFIQYYDHQTRQVETSFLSCQNILEEYESANATALTELILKSLEENGLQVAKLTGFSSDGASVMMGEKSGVATQLRRQNPSLINIHCVCHKLALSCTDTNESLKYIKEVETWLKQLWYFFENSPKRMAKYLKTQIALKKVNLSKSTTKTVASKLKKACRTRWLSLEASVKAVFQDYEAVLQTLDYFENSDATASGLLKKMKTIKFLGVLYILVDVLPVLGNLSRSFQRDSLNFSSIRPQIELTTGRLDDILEHGTPLNKLQQDIDSISRISDDLNLSPRGMNELRNLFEKYIPALKQNILRRFESSSEILAALGVFDPLSVPGVKQPGFKDHGSSDMTIIADHFSIDQDKLLTEWKGMKYHIADVLIPKMPLKVRTGSEKQTPTEWFILQLLIQPTYRGFFPLLCFIAEVAATLPVTNAWPERGASALKNLKTRHRNRINSDMLNALLHVSINGPAVSEAGQLVKTAVSLWLAAKKRYKLAKKSSVPSLSVPPATATVEVQTDPVVVVDQETLREEVQAAVKAFHLQDYSDEKASESDEEFEEEFDKCFECA